MILHLSSTWKGRHRVNSQVLICPLSPLFVNVFRCRFGCSKSVCANKSWGEKTWASLRTVCVCCLYNDIHIYTHIHTHVYIYMCVCLSWPSKQFQPIAQVIAPCAQNWHTGNSLDVYNGCDFLQTHQWFAMVVARLCLVLRHDKQTPRKLDWMQFSIFTMNNLPNWNCLVTLAVSNMQVYCH